MKKGFLSVLVACLMFLGGGLFLSGCGGDDKNDKGGGSSPFDESNYKVVFNVTTQTDQDKGYYMHSFNTISDSGAYSNDTASQFKVRENEKVRFVLELEKGWIVDAAEKNNFKVFLSSDEQISEDDTEIEKVDSVGPSVGAGITNDYLANYVNAYLRSLSAAGTEPENVPIKTTLSLYFNTYTGQRLNMTDEAYGLLSNEVVELSENAEITSQTQVSAFYQRTLDQVLTTDYDVDRQITYEIDGMTEGNYYILVQTDSAKSQDLQMVHRSIKLKIPDSSTDPYISYAEFDDMNDRVGETYTRDQGQDYKTIMKPYGTQINLCTIINTNEEHEAKYYEISIDGESTITPSWTNFPGHGRDTIWSRLSDDGKQHSQLMSLVFAQSSQTEVGELGLTTYLKQRVMAVEIKDNGGQNYYISNTIEGDDTKNYEEKGFELQFYDQSTGEWREFDYSNQEVCRYLYSFGINNDFQFRIKIDETKNRFTNASYALSYGEMATSHGGGNVEYGDPIAITGTVDTTTQGGVIFINFQPIPQQTGGINELNTCDIRFIITGVNSTDSIQP